MALGLNLREIRWGCLHGEWPKHCRLHQCREEASLGRLRQGRASLKG